VPYTLQVTIPDSDEILVPSYEIPIKQVNSLLDLEIGEGAPADNFPDIPSPLHELRGGQPHIHYARDEDNNLYVFRFMLCAPEPNQNTVLWQDVIALWKRFE
jgi:hypothetical protein